MKRHLIYLPLFTLTLSLLFFFNINSALAAPQLNSGEGNAPAIPLNPNKGLALATAHPEDLISLRVSWWYVWGWCDQPNCVPMVRNMELPPACPPILLVGNEPNAREPNGAPQTPAVAATRVRAIEQKCPATKLVVGNVSYDDWSSVGGWGSGANWLKEFLAEYQKQSGKPFKQALGVHCYSQSTAAYCLTGLAQLRQLYQGEMWVTQFGILSGDPTEFATLLDYVSKNFTRYAAYTNRQPHTGEGWELSAGVELVNANGTLKPMGLVYARK